MDCFQSNRNLDWIVWVFGWYSWLRDWCLRLYCVVGILKINIVNLFIDSCWLWKVFCLELLQDWICFVFMYFMSVLFCLCFCWLDWEEVVHEKFELHISWYFILWLEVWLCFHVCYCCIVEQVLLLICCWILWILNLVVNWFCGGDSFRLLLSKYLRCHCISGCQKLT
jgi:hypothetical protein